MIFLTAHGGENIGVNLYNMFSSIMKVINEFEDIKVIYPLHLKSLVREIAYNVFQGYSRVKLIEPLVVIEII